MNSTASHIHTCSKYCQESNFKNVTFFCLCFVVVAAFLGDKYYAYLAQGRRKRRAGEAPRNSGGEADRLALLTKAVRRVVKEKSLA